MSVDDKVTVELDYDQATYVIQLFQYLQEQNSEKTNFGYFFLPTNLQADALKDAHFMRLFYGELLRVFNDAYLKGGKGARHMDGRVGEGYHHWRDQ